MSNERLEVLQMLADGKIDAVQAAAMLRDTTPAAKTERAEPISENSESDDSGEIELEIDIDEEIMIEKSSKTHPPTIMVATDASDTDSAESAEPVEIIETNVKHKQSDGAQKLCVTVSGKPIHANLNITVPVSLLKFGTHIGSYFEPKIDGADWESLDVEFMAGEQTIRLVVE